MSRVLFLYLNGTDPILAQIAAGLGQAFGQPSLGTLVVKGLNGVTTPWINGTPNNDPFCNLLDPQIFQAVKLPYPALGIPMKASINTGINVLASVINQLPKTQRFMIGGYSQGAVVAGTVERMLRPGGNLASKASQYLGGVCFGSPIRQTNYRGEVGGNWSGAWDIPGSTTGGGGAFAANGPFPRLTNCDPNRWIEFADTDDIFSATGSSTRGQNWSKGTSAFLDLLNIPAVINAIFTVLPDVQAAFTKGGVALNYTDANGRPFSIGGNGHAAYPWRPPPGNPDNGLTSYQIAAKWLTTKANETVTAPILLPGTPSSSPTTAGWATTLTPPAA